MKAARRIPQFVERDSRRLYTVRFPGDGQAGIAVICQPLGDEAVKARRVMFDVARRLGERGLDTWLFDYRGTGNSSGDFENLEWEGMLEDTVEIVQEARRVSGNKIVTLAGLRLGATVAALTAERVEGVSQLLLLDPIVQVLPYLRETLRVNLATQMVIHGKVLYNRELLEAMIRKGEVVDINGFPLCRPLLESAQEVNLLDQVSSFRGRALIVPISSMAKARIPDEVTKLAARYADLGARCEVRPAKERPFWTELKEYYPAAPNLLEIALSLWQEATP